MHLNLACVTKAEHDITPPIMHGGGSPGGQHSMDKRELQRLKLYGNTALARPDIESANILANQKGCTNPMSPVTRERLRTGTGTGSGTGHSPGHFWSR